MSNDPTIELLKSRGNLKRDGLVGALENLHYKYGSIFDFEPVGLVDDKKFRESNPDHPMAEPQRFIRQEAADYVNDIAGRSSSLIDHVALESFHKALFDRDPAVRMAIAEALGKLKKAESIESLKRLLSTETESQWVKSAAEKSLRACHGR
jgi:hypothetical protein